jgi:hypothetical protein
MSLPESLAKAVLYAACVKIVRISAECVKGWWINISEMFDSIEHALSTSSLFVEANKLYIRSMMGAAFSKALNAVTGDKTLEVMNKEVALPNKHKLCRKWVRSTNATNRPVHPGMNTTAFECVGTSTPSAVPGSLWLPSAEHQSQIRQHALRLLGEATTEIHSILGITDATEMSHVGSAAGSTSTSTTRPLAPPSPSRSSTPPPPRHPPPRPPLVDNSWVVLANNFAINDISDASNNDKDISDMVRVNSEGEILCLFLSE